jgi:hypothetical protein
MADTVIRIKFKDEASATLKDITAHLEAIHTELALRQKGHCRRAWGPAIRIISRMALWLFAKFLKRSLEAI